MLKRREECDTYLTHIYRHHRSAENLVFSQGSLHYSDLYRRKSGRHHTIPCFFNILLGFLLYYYIKFSDDYSTIPFSKVCSQWVLRMVTEENKKRKTIATCSTSI